MLSDTKAHALNRRIARAMGWQRIDAATVDGGPYWTLPDGGMNDAPPFGTDYEGRRYGDFYVLPDFCRDAMALGYLVEWLEKQSLPHWAVGFSTMHDHRFKSSLYANEHDSYSYSCCFTAGEALARAILSYKAGKDSSNDSNRGDDHQHKGDDQ